MSCICKNSIQKQMFNTIYQLMALKVKRPEELKEAKTLLMIPDYFHFLLTGKKASEYTNATTGQLVSPTSKDWDMEMIEKLGYPTEIFQKLSLPGTVLGELTNEVASEVGFNCQVVLPATHNHRICSHCGSYQSGGYFVYQLRNMVFDGNGVKGSKLLQGEQRE